MKVYECSGCRWRFIIHKKHVYGPIFEDRSATAARVMTLEHLKDGYYDCYPRLEEVTR